MKPAPDLSRSPDTPDIPLLVSENELFHVQNALLRERQCLEEWMELEPDCERWTKAWRVVNDLLVRLGEL